MEKAPILILANLTYQWLGPAVFVSAGVAFLLLFAHDRKQFATLKLSGAFFFAGIGFTLIMLVDGDVSRVYQATVQSSLFVSHFLLMWGVASLYERRFPKVPFGLAVMVAAGVIGYTLFQPTLFWLRVATASGFIVFVDLMCSVLVWRARRHRVDTVLAGIFAIQAALTSVRIIQPFLPGAELLTLDTISGSPFMASMQTANSLFAIVMGLALFARYSTTLVMRLNRLAETDPLTGLLNRRDFDTKVDLLRAAAAPLPTGLIICDIDSFKQVNDTHGHHVGDTVLQAVARLLQDEAGEASLCVRLGGEEFCILLPEANIEMTRLAATRLRVAIETQKIVSSGRRLELTASFGFCQLAPEDDFRTAMANVDAAVYQAKADGRNLVRIATDVVTTAVDLAPVADRPPARDSGR
ncbi:MAG: GGDEF domain-containing protein [Hoeflea sp.]|uniref:GGDEF domain-containing protein n=1 Tax=Hoeflea sp. TaxID=1940281 RepID=UPI003EF4DCC2